MTYAEAVGKRLLGKTVELYLGDMGQTQKFADNEVSHKEIIIGTLVETIGDLLVVEVVRNGASNLVYINGWAVRLCLASSPDVRICNIYKLESEK